MQSCKNTPNIRYNLNRVMKHADRMIFGCIETNEFVGTFFENSGNKMISDIIREQLLRFTFKIENEDHGMVELVKQLKGIPGAEEPIYETHKGLRGSMADYGAHWQSYKVSYIRCVKSLMSMVGKCAVEISPTANYDYKPYEEVVNIADMTAIRRNLKTNLLYVFG